MFKKLKYKFDTALERDFSNLLFLLFVFSLFGVFIFAALFYMLQIVGLTSKDVTFFEFFWQSFTFFLDVGALSGDESKNNLLEIILKIGITAFGIIIFSTLIGIITSTLTLRIEELRSGKSVVDEKNHIIICNFTKKTIPLIQELITANGNKQIVITILSNMQPVDAQLRISNQIKKRPNVKIICRRGFMWQPEMIEIMNVDQCKQIIILNPDVDGENYKTELDTDIEVTKDFSAVVQSKSWSKNPCNIIVEYFNPTVGKQTLNFNHEILRDNKNKIKLISSADIKELLIAHCINTPELVQIFESLFGFEGSEIYLVDEKNTTNFSNIYGKTIQDLNRQFNKIIVIGCFYNDNEKTEPNIILNPASNFKIKKNYGLICIALNEDQINIEFFQFDNPKVEKIKEIEISLSEENHNKNLMIINTSDNKDKLIKTSNEIVKSNFQKNIKNIKILSTEEVDQTKLINFSENKFSNIILGVEFQPIEIINKNKSFWIFQITNKFSIEDKTFSDLFEMGDYLLQYDHIREKPKNYSWEEFTTGRASTYENTLESLRLLVPNMGHCPDNYNLGIWTTKKINSEIEVKLINKSKSKKLYDIFYNSDKEEKNKIKYFVKKLDLEKIEHNFQNFFDDEEINKNTNVLVINNEIEGTNKINPVEDHDMLNYYISISNGFKRSPKLYSLDEEEKWKDRESFNYELYKEELIKDSEQIKLNPNKKIEPNIDYIEDLFNQTKEFTKDDYIKLLRLDTSKSPSYITEVNSFRTKRILENFKKNVYQSFFGTDIIDLSSIIGKMIASTFYQPSSLEIVKNLLEKNHFIKSFTIEDRSLAVTFRELEAYFQKHNHILIGYIDYDYSTHVEGGERKIRKIELNPDQTEILKLNRGDRLITISHV